MKRVWNLFLMPISIIVVPSKKKKFFKRVFPLWGLTLLGVFSLAIMVGAISLTYYKLHQSEKELVFWQNKYQQDVASLKNTLVQLKQTEQKLRSLLKLGSKEEIIKQAEFKDLPSSSGAVEIEDIKQEIEKRIRSISSLKVYLKRQKSIYLATPLGWPTSGYISSSFGWRIHPITGLKDFHHGVDIAASIGTPVKSTANGIVVYTGRTKGNGNFVIIEHGCGYSTLYAHLKKYIVKEGQEVKRGDVIGYVGSTGLSTGSHLHYEVWKNKKRINPLPYIKEKINFAQG